MRPLPRPGTLALIALAALGAALVASLALGPVRVGPNDVIHILLRHIFHRAPYPMAAADAADAIVWDIRLPRAGLALLVGAGLALAGAGFQGVLANPLAEPYLLGTSAGASLGAVGILLLGWEARWLGWGQPAAAFAGGVISLLLVLGLGARARGRRSHGFLLAGVVVNALLGALLAAQLSLRPDRAGPALYWLLGSLSLRGWGYASILAPCLAAAALYLAFQARALNLLELGEEQARHGGVDLRALRLGVLAAGSLLTAACVSTCGVVGFVGLAAPHAARFLVGHDYRRVLPCSAWAGALLLLASDDLARCASAPGELPLGVITALAGAPFLGWLIARRNDQDA